MDSKICVILTTNYWSPSLGGVAILWLLEITICFKFHIRGIKDNDNKTFIPIVMTIFYFGFGIIGLRTPNKTEKRSKRQQG